MRATSIPAAINASSTPGTSVAGPSVVTMRVRRLTEELPEKCVRRIQEYSWTSNMLSSLVGPATKSLLSPAKLVDYTFYQTGVDLSTT